MSSSQRVCVITGATGGIGLATAIAMARRGHALRVIGRSEAKLEATRAVLASETRDVAVLRADLSSLASVRACASALLARDEPIHVLINNAGVWHPSFQRSVDGIEDTFAVNHLAHFVLTNALLPRMRESDGDRRIVHVSSRLHVQAGQTATLAGRAVHALNVMGVRAGARGARMDWDAIDDERSYRGIEAYARSKLAQVIYSAELARRERDVTSSAVHPGSVATDVTRENPLLAALAPLARYVLKTPEQGARTSVYAACDPSLRGVSGGYYANARAAAAAPIASDAAIAARVWTLSESLSR